MTFYTAVLSTTPQTFYTASLLHRMTFYTAVLSTTPQTFYTASLLHRMTFYTAVLSTTPQTFYTASFLHRMLFLHRSTFEDEGPTHRHVYDARDASRHRRPVMDERQGEVTTASLQREERRNARQSDRQEILSPQRKRSNRRHDDSYSPEGRENYEEQTRQREREERGDVYYEESEGNRSRPRGNDENDRGITRPRKSTRSYYDDYGRADDGRDDRTHQADLYDRPRDRNRGHRDEEEEHEWRRRQTPARRRLPAIPGSDDSESKPKRKPAQPEKFDGTTSVEAFLEQFHTCASYNRWDEEDKLVQLKLCLKGSAAGLLKDCREDVKTFAALENKIKQRFDAKGREASFRAQLRARRRMKGESLQDLYISISDLIHSAYPGKSTEHKDSMACDAFIDALDDASLEQRVRDKLPDNLDEAYRLAVVMEANTRGAEHKAFERLKGGGHRYEARAAFGNGETKADHNEKNEPENGNKEEMSVLIKSIEKLCQKVDEMKNEGWRGSINAGRNQGGTRKDMEIAISVRIATIGRPSVL